MQRLVIVALGSAVVAGCAARGPTSEGASTALACQGLANTTIPAARISLPTTGARITKATLVPASDAGNPNGEYCRILGSIKPVDPTAPDIHFQVNLPTRWNGKALQVGGGGYNGHIPQTVSVEPHGLRNAPTPLARGFMTFASDSGHQAANADDAEFALNDEALANYAGQHIKKSRDVADALAELRYHSRIRRAYFSGGSTGGREALTAAMRWPESYDGVISHYPTANFMGLRLWGSALAHAIYDNDSAGWIPPAMVRKIAADSTAACDELDGVKDNIVSNMAACRARSAALLDRLTCRNGETGHPASCLTAAQLRTIRVYHEGYTLPYAFANGIASYTGYNSLEGITMQVGSQAAYIDPPPSGPNAHHVNRADQFVKYFLTRDPRFKLLALDIQNPGPWQARIQALSAAIDATNPDLSAFKAKGGKIMLAQGDDDASVSPYANARWYQSVVNTMGRAATDSFMRFYMVPGFAHASGKFLLSWDALSALDAWVETGAAPGTLVGVDANTAASTSATNGRTRPLCVFPAWPKYKGTGSVNAASSFECVLQ